MKVTHHRCHPEKRADGERAVGKQARKYSLLHTVYRMVLPPYQIQIRVRHDKASVGWRVVLTRPRGAGEVDRYYIRLINLKRTLRDLAGRP